jgi:hypothetical protein
MYIRNVDSNYWNTVVIINDQQLAISWQLSEPLSPE